MENQAGPTPIRPRKRSDHERLAEILLARGWLGQDALKLVRREQSQTGQGIGRTALALGHISEQDLAKAEAEAHGVGFADLLREPPDPGLIDATMLDTYVAYRILPWRRVGRLIAFATARPDQAEAALKILCHGSDMAVFVVAEGAILDQALADVLALELADKAVRRAPWSASVRSLSPHRVGLATGLLAWLGFMIARPDIGLVVLGFALLILSLATTLARIASLCASSSTDPPLRKTPDGAIELAAHRTLPVVTLLIPMYREAEMVPKIVANLHQLDYPRALLDVKLLLEQDDPETREAARLANLPSWISTLVVPDGAPRTKPRAMNIALDFCVGEIIGIFDAEDRPERDQVMSVATLLRQAPPEVACIQCQLSYFNIRENWLSRCFQIEYSIWFDVLLRGWQRLGLPVPLGGTSVYFRRSVLAASGGWDAHNVTEDADLGMRLARKGFKTWLIRSTTYEEANCRLLAWIRQRSRWLKGYMLTWMSHMRRPIALWRDLGPVGFIGFQVLFLGGAASYLAMPLLWAALTMTLILGESVYGNAMPGWALAVLAGSLLTGQIVMVISAFLALARRRMIGLMFWVPTVLVYWTMGAVAAWKAIVEMIVAPYYWDKTKHGVTRLADTGDKPTTTNLHTEG